MLKSIQQTLILALCSTPAIAGAATLNVEEAKNVAADKDYCSFIICILFLVISVILNSIIK